MKNTTKIIYLGIASLASSCMLPYTARLDQNTGDQPKLVSKLTLDNEEITTNTTVYDLDNARNIGKCNYSKPIRTQIGLVINEECDTDNDSKPDYISRMRLGDRKPYKEAFVLPSRDGKKTSEDCIYREFEMKEDGTRGNLASKEFGLCKRVYDLMKK